MRSTLRTGMTLTVIALLFLAFNLAWIVKLPNIRWDFSQQKIHSLSSPARQLLASVSSPLDLYYFNAHNTPKRSYALQRYAKRIEDLLREYEKAADGMINLHVIDPKPFSEDAYKAGLFGLDDEMGFLGLIGTQAGHGAQRIESFSLDREPLLEYEISHLIFKLQHPEPPVIGLLSGLAMQDTSSQLLKELQQHFDVANLETTTDNVPEHIQTLMVVHPKALPERALYAIEQFVLRGGRLMMFIDPLSEQDLPVSATNSRLDALLAAWGIEMPADKLLIDNLYAIPQTPDARKVGVQHPARLKLPRKAMNAHDISTWKLDTVVVSSSGALSRRQKVRTTFTPLLQSSSQSALLETDRFTSATTLSSLLDEASGPGQSHVIAARIEGPAYSAFADGLAGQPAGLQKATQIHVVVVADTDLLTDQVGRLASDSNTLFVLNTLDNLSAADTLASIRPRAAPDSSISVLGQMRAAAARAYDEQATQLHKRLQRTEREWQRMNPQELALGTEAVDTGSTLQALNKERLRLPMELQALKVKTYAHVHRIEQAIKLVLTLAMPLTLCVVAWLMLLRQRRRLRHGPVFY
ncbi:MAG: Gldg family protein [Pseudomonas sp.]|uniref:Gldg family protein n=1 Tax=Pseudomonas sp. TaxID=306 RepID=UPI00391BE9C6